MLATLADLNKVIDRVAILEIKIRKLDAILEGLDREKGDK
jgi:hypothetical protein